MRDNWFVGGAPSYFEQRLSLNYLANKGSQTSQKNIEEELSPVTRRVIARVAGCDEDVQEIAKVLFDLSEAPTEPEDEEEDAFPVDPFGLLVTKRGDCYYVFAKAGMVYEQSEGVGKTLVLLLIRSNLVATSILELFVKKSKDLS